MLAHETFSICRSGAGQAIESGYIIGKLLSRKDCNSRNISEFLKIYESVRKPRHDLVKQESRHNGEIYECVGFGTYGGPEELRGKPLGQDGSEEQYKALGAELTVRADWIFKFQIEETLDEAMRLADELTGSTTA